MGKRILAIAVSISILFTSCWIPSNASDQTTGNATVQSVEEVQNVEESITEYEQKSNEESKNLENVEEPQHEEETEKNVESDENRIRETYTVIYHGNGATSGSMEPSVHIMNESKALSPNKFTKVGFSGVKYKFSGWSITSDGKPAYMDEEEVINLTDTPNGVVDLYATWREDNNTFRVIYKPNGGLGEDLNQVILPNQSWNTHGALYTKVGYALESWNTKPDGSGKRYELNATQGVIDRDLVLYAQYKPVGYTIKYHGNGHDSGATPDSSHTYDVEKPLSKNGYKKEGYVFKGWTTNPPVSEGTLLAGERFNALIPAGITEIIFTDEEVPDNAVNPVDVSVEQNQSIMAWTEAGTTTWKVSSLIPGMKVKANADCSFLLADDMFIRSVQHIDLANLDTSNTVNMMNMFAFCRDLVTLDVSALETSHVTNMQGMFNNCKKLVTLDVSGFDTSNVTDMSYMFNHCYALETLNVSTLDTSNVTTMSSMFAFCYALKTIDVTSFDTSHVDKMVSMFENCRSLLVIDVSGFDTSNVTDISSMFEGCNSIIVLDLSSFNTVKVKWIMKMFKNCNNLKTVYVGQNWNMDRIIESYDMFTGCNSIVGQSGTRYSVSNVNNVSMANWRFGYLTYKEFVPARSLFNTAGFKMKDFYKDQEVVVNLTDVDGKVINMYAVWEKSEDIVIVYDGNGHDSGTPKTEVVKNSDVQESGYIVKKNEGFTSYKKEKHSFIGWDPDKKKPSYEAAYKESSSENKISYEELMKIVEVQSAEGMNTLSEKEKKKLEVSPDAPVATLYATWDQAPELLPETPSKMIEFYEGEKVTKEDLIEHLNVFDREDSNQNKPLEKDDIHITKIRYAEGKIMNGEKQPAYETIWETDMGKNDLLDTWFLQLDKKDSPVTHKATFEVTDSAGNTTKLELPVIVKYNEFPEIKAEERHFTLEEANNGVITEEELLKRIRAWDLEDCHDKPIKDHTCNHLEGTNCLEDLEKCAFAKKVELAEFSPEEFKNLTESVYIAVPCKVVDQFGKETMAQIDVYISKDGEVVLPEKAKRVRFINEEYYRLNENVDLEGMSEEELKERNSNGGLNVKSKWYNQEEYRELIQSCWQNESTKQSWKFTPTDVQRVKTYIEENGIGNAERSSGLSGFVDRFKSCMQ